VTEEDAQPPAEDTGAGVGDLTLLLAEFEAQGPRAEQAEPVIMVEDTLTAGAADGAGMLEAEAEPAMGETAKPALETKPKETQEAKTNILVVVSDSPEVKTGEVSQSTAGLIPEISCLTTLKVCIIIVAQEFQTMSAERTEHLAASPGRCFC
jgi:hypothetical protein